MAEIFPAATVVVIRDSQEGLEVLLLQRSKQLEYAGGAWVFPGGRIDALDYDNKPDDMLTAAYNAAIREAREEASLVLDVEKLLYLSHWTAPPETSKRFATWFFLSAVQNDIDVTVDGYEIDRHCWYRPQDAINARNNNRIELMPPTFVTLTELAKYRCVDDVHGLIKGRVAPVFEPKITIQGHKLCALYAGDAYYSEAQGLNAGARHRLWMLDSEWVYENNLTPFKK